MKMASQSLTSAEISSKISYARDALANLRDEENDLALPAVSGNADAAARIGDIRSQARQIEGDISILVRAQEAAVLSEIKDSEARSAEYRASHLAIAKKRAGEIVAAADRAEKLIVELQSVLGEISVIEQAIWSEMREAGEPPGSGIVGRKGLATMALDRAVLLIDGRHRFAGEKRTTPEIAKAAWSHLLQEDHGDDI